MKLYIARDSNDGLYIHFTKLKCDGYWFISERFIRIDSFLFPEVTFENSPMEVELKLINNMKIIQTKKHILKEWCESNMNIHTDWTGSRVETKDTCDTINVFVDKLWNYLEDESDRMDD